MTKVLLATMDTFTKQGRFVSKGQPVTADEVDFDDDNNGNLTKAPASLTGQAPVVEISAIAPTGPNPTAPQQVAPGTVQTVAGYEQNGAILVGEVTKPEKERITIVGIDSKKGASAQADVAEALEQAAVDQQDAAEADRKAAAAEAKAARKTS